MASTLISFMAKLTPELLNECEAVFAADNSVSCRDITFAADTIRAVREVELAHISEPAPRKRGRPTNAERAKRGKASDANAIA